MNIGTVIKKARRAKNLTQEALAKKIEIGRTTLWKWEKGVSIPAGDKLIRIMLALELAPVDFV